MMSLKILKRAYTTLLVLGACFLPATHTVLVQAQGVTEVNCGAVVDVRAGCEGPTDAQKAEADTKVNNLVKRSVQIFQVIVGIIALFMVISGGLNYITAGGDSAKLKTARERLIYAVIGLVIVGIAQTIVQFALNRAANSGTGNL